jgi:hypothetical protein
VYDTSSGGETTEDGEVEEEEEEEAEWMDTEGGGSEEEAGVKVQQPQTQTQMLQQQQQQQQRGFPAQQNGGSRVKVKGKRGGSGSLVGVKEEVQVHRRGKCEEESMKAVSCRCGVQMEQTLLSRPEPREFVFLYFIF